MATDIGRGDMPMVATMATVLDLLGALMILGGLWALAGWAAALFGLGVLTLAAGVAFDFWELGR